MDPLKSYYAPETKLHFLDYWRIIRIRKTVILGGLFARRHHGHAGDIYSARILRQHRPDQGRT